MSVLVKGMEMPKTCEECSFGYEEDAAWMACIPQGVSVRKESVSGICDPNCPLVEVPAPHGRLIDADALDYKLGASDRDIYVRCTLEEDAPTVIEAEGME